MLSRAAERERPERVRVRHRRPGALVGHELHEHQRMGVESGREADEVTGAVAPRRPSSAMFDEPDDSASGVERDDHQGSARNGAAMC